MFGFGKKKKLPELPVVENELGRFTMDYTIKNEPTYSYMGNTKILRKNGLAYVYADVECDDRETMSADKGFARLSGVLAGFSDWDERIKKNALDFAVKEYGLDGGLIEIWGSWDPKNFDGDYHDEPVTREDFIKRIYIAGISVYADGEIEFCVDLDDMFTDHGLYIRVDKDGNIVYCDLQG